MTDEERLGQLFIIRAHSDKGPEHIESVKKLITDYHVGGLCFFQGNPQGQAELTNEYQNLAKLPLMISMDAEWGLGMRFKDGVVQFPRQLMMGAVQDNSLIYDFGKEVARECRRLGVHLNFAPVIDINNNPNNPVINDRSFGEDKYNVALKGFQYMKGLQDGQVMACAKHFPGHGDTDADSHFELPLIKHDSAHLYNLELYPFQFLAKQGLQSLMVAHLSVPALDSTKNLPTTLSRKVVTGIIRDQYQFDGLIITDALEMKGVTKYYDYGEVESKALIAGNDLLLLPESVPLAFVAIQKAIANGTLSQAQVDSSVRRVLTSKYRLGLWEPQQIQIDNLWEDLNKNEALGIKQQIIQQAITVVGNKDNLIPIKKFASLSIASICIGVPAKAPFQTELNRYYPVESSNLPSSFSVIQAQAVVQKLSKKDFVIVGVHNMTRSSGKNFGISPQTITLIEQLQAKTKVLVVVFGNPYSLKNFDNCRNVIMAYEADPMTQRVTAQGIFGAFSFTGRLPISASAKYICHDGIKTDNLYRLQYGEPSLAHLDAEALKKIDQLAEDAIRKEAIPGCQILVAKNGIVVYDKSFGTQTYMEEKPVLSSDIYDLASVTKVAATTMAVMKLQEMGEIDLNEPISRYLPELMGTNKDSLTLIQIMTHTAGLKPYIPFYQETLEKDSTSFCPSPLYYCNVNEDDFQIEVATNLFLTTTYEDVIWKEIIQSELNPKKEYKYSDLGFIMIARMVNRLTGKPLDIFVNESFYKGLNMSNTTFNPLKTIDPNRIIPSEEDQYFRNQRLQGHVHDMAAAMLGGISGHAGLFSNTADLAVLMQMLLNNGYYGGTQYLYPETINYFTSRPPGRTRRGIGFDMKQLDNRLAANLPSRSSDMIFGHTGFTGTCIWADPKYNLIYIFLSNRTYPSMRNNKLNQLDTRDRILSAIYKSFLPDDITVTNP